MVFQDSDAVKLEALWWTPNDSLMGSELQLRPFGFQEFVGCFHSDEKRQVLHQHQLCFILFSTVSCFFFVGSLYAMLAIIILPFPLRVVVIWCQAKIAEFLWQDELAELEVRGKFHPLEVRDGELFVLKTNQAIFVRRSAPRWRRT